MNVIIDRFEGEYAVVELPDGTMANVPKVLFAGAAEGDVFSVVKDEGATKSKKEKIKGLMASLFEE